MVLLLLPALFHRPLPGLFLFASLVFIVLHSLWFESWIVDDAAISFTYAKNLAEHGELSLFPGGERTEGFSNPLWVLAFALFARLNLFDPVVTPKIFGLLLQTLSLVLIVQIGRRLAPTVPRWALYIPSLLLSTCSAFVLWGISGLENPLVTALLLLCLHRLIHEHDRQRSGIVSGVLFFLLASTRPEGVMYGAMAWLVLAGQCLRQRAARSEAFLIRRRHLLGYTFAFGTTFLVLILCRWLYFYDVAPNPYYAKMGKTFEYPVAATIENGLRYLRNGIGAHWWNLLLPFVLLSLARISRFEVAVLWSATLVAIAFPLYSGGDWMMEFRFLTALYPLYLLSALVGSAVLLEYARLRSSGVFQGFMAALAIFLVTVGATRAWQRSSRAKAQPTLGMSVPMSTAKSFRDWADATGLRHATVMLPDIGGSSYFGREHNLEILDLGGLADRFVGRLGLGDHVWRYVTDLHRPDFITFHQSWSVEIDIQRSATFQQMYHPIWKHRDSAFDEMYPDRLYLQSAAYVRRDLISVPESRISVPMSGPEVGGILFRGWSQPRCTVDERLVVTVYWEVVRKGPFPHFLLEWQPTAGDAVRTAWTRLAGGCYRPEFSRIGDIVPTTIALGSLTRQQTPTPRRVRILAYQGDREVEVAQHTLTPVVETVPDAKRILDEGRRLIAGGELESCLDHVDSLRDNQISALEPHMVQLQRELSRAFVTRAKTKEAGPDLLGGIQTSWQDYWNAWRAWKAFSPALVRCIDYWNVWSLTSGSTESIEDRLNGVRWSKPITLAEIYGGLLDSPFPFHQARLVQERGRIRDSTLPALPQRLVYLYGWQQEEDWGRWAIEKVSHVYLEHDGTSFLRLRTASWPGMTEPQSASLYFEGSLLGSLIIEGDHWRMADFDFSLPSMPTYGVLSIEVNRLYEDSLDPARRYALPVEMIDIESK